MKTSLLSSEIEGSFEDVRGCCYYCSLAAAATSVENSSANSVSIGSLLSLIWVGRHTADFKEAPPLF